MKTNLKKIMTLFLVAFMVFGLIQEKPNRLLAADPDPATINIGTLNPSGENNSSRPTEAQWYYAGTGYSLSFISENGSYTLTGTNTDFRLFSNLNAVNLVFSSMSLTSASGSSIGFEIYNSNAGVTLQGNNYLTHDDPFSVWQTVYISGELVFKGNGNLTITDNFNGAVGISSGSSLRILESAEVRVQPSVTNNRQAIFQGTNAHIYIGDNASLELTNNYTIKETHLFEAATPSANYKWKLVNATTTDNLTDANITVDIAPGATAIISRESTAITPVAPNITGPTTMTLTEGYSATSSNAFTITGTPTPTVSKTSGNGAITWNNTTKKLDIAAGLTVGSYPVTLKATNGVNPDKTFNFTLIVSRDTSLIDKYTEAAITNTPVADAEYYQVQRSTSKTKGFATVGTTTGGSFIDYYLKPNTTYYYRVRSVKTVNKKLVYGAFAPVVTVKTSALPIPNDVTLTAELASLKGTWTNTNNMSAVQILYSTNKKTWTTRTYDVADFDIMKLKANTKYFYKIRYIYYNGTTSYSAYSAVKEINTR